MSWQVTYAWSCFVPGNVLEYVQDTNEWMNDWLLVIEWLIDWMIEPTYWYVTCMQFWWKNGTPLQGVPNFVNILMGLGFSLYSYDLVREALRDKGTPHTLDLHPGPPHIQECAPLLSSPINCLSVPRNNETWHFEDVKCLSWNVYLSQELDPWMTSGRGCDPITWSVWLPHYTTKAQVTKRTLDSLHKSGLHHGWG